MRPGEFFGVLLFVCAGACIPEGLDPVVTAGSSSSGTAGGGTGPGFSASEAAGSSGAPTTSSEPGETTGDITTGPVDPGDTTTGTGDGSSSTTGDDSSTGPGSSSGDTGGSLLEPCPVDAPIVVDVHGTTPLGPFTAATGVFFWDQASNLMLVIDFLPEVPALPWDLELNGHEYVSLALGGVDEFDPQLWLGERTVSIYHTNIQDWVQVFDVPITITGDTLEPWSLAWDDYDHEPVLGGSFELKQDGWDLTGTFVVPYCHPLSVFHPF